LGFGQSNHKKAIPIINIYIRPSKESYPAPPCVNKQSTPTPAILLLTQSGIAHSYKLFTYKNNKGTNDQNMP